MTMGKQTQDTNHASACPPLGEGLEGNKPEHVIFWPAQCNCGHIFLEKYQFAELTKEGNIGFRLIFLNEEVRHENI